MNMAITDYITIAAILYFAQKGWRKGLMRTALGPISLAAGVIIGVVYYHKSHNMTMSFLAGAVSPFIIRFLATLLLALWVKSSNEKPTLSTLSRLTGCAFSILWGGCYLAVFLILLGLAPFRFGPLEKIHADVTGSKSYALLNRWIGKKSPVSSTNLTKISNVLSDPRQLEQYKTTEEFNSLMEDKQMRDILADEEITVQINKQDYAKLLTNPKIQAIFQDEQLIKKIMALNKVILETETGGTGKTAGKAPAGPKVVEVK